jgi:hypothetical protein
MDYKRFGIIWRGHVGLPLAVEFDKVAEYTGLCINSVLKTHMARSMNWCLGNLPLRLVPVTTVIEATAA